jgi:tRNA (adenine57-N1/adenine58-N1)-methyltransferase
MYETLAKPHDVGNVPMQTVDDAASRLRDIEIRKEERRLKQIETAARDKKRKRLDASSEEQSIDSSKRTKVETEVHASAELVCKLYNVLRAIELDLLLTWFLAEFDSISPPANILPSALPKPKRAPHHPNAAVSVAPEAERYIVSKPFSEVRGHTSYLTFAMLVPSTCSGVQPEETIESGPDSNGLNFARESKDRSVTNHHAPSVEPTETSTTLDSLIAAMPEEVRSGSLLTFIVT